MSRYLAPRPTPTTCEAIFASFRRATAEGPQALLVLTAHVALETGDGARMRNWSAGGVKATPGGAYDWTYYDTHEGAGAARVPFAAPPLEAQNGIDRAELARLEGSADERDRALAKRVRVTCFRAFESLDAATSAHVTIISGRWPEAWRGAVAGDPIAFARGLVVGPRYHTSDPEEYAAALAQRHAQCAAAMPTWRADV